MSISVLSDAAHTAGAAGSAGTMLLAQPSIGAGVPLRELALVILIGCTVTYLVTGVVRSLVVRYGRIAAPRERDVHTVPIPRLGGVAMFTGFIVAVVVAGQFPALTRGFPPVTPDMTAVISAAFIIVVVGVVDDRGSSSSAGRSSVPSP